MMTSPIQNIYSSKKTGHSRSHDFSSSIRILEQEIASLDLELQNIDSRIRSLESQIHSRYSNEIQSIRKLALLYKSQKRAKKEKRLEQKKRGKNYREPTGLTKITSVTTDTGKPVSTKSQELKKLYREAVRLVHPDKFSNETAERCSRSQELTIQLIDIYQSGDLEQLKFIHRHILSGNAMSHTPCQENSIPDPDALYSYLSKKRDDLIAAISESKQSRIYEVLTTYNDPLRFIDELSGQLLLRIQQLEKRTRK
jgi:hypothetical protein